MERTADHEVFVANPVGRALVGPTWVYWCARPELFGIVLWGRPNEDDVRALERGLRVELGDGIVPHGSLVDARGLTGVDGEAFAVLNAYVTENHARLAERVTRLALVKPAGLAGAVTAGFYEVLDSPYPVQLFNDPAEALAWLDPTADGALLAEVEAITADASGVVPFIGSLRAIIADDLKEIELARAAKSLGVSERTLQRRLKREGTTFQNELGIVRIKEAQRRMIDSDRSLTAIALDVGFASLQHFSSLFRKITGEQPSAWRKHR